MEGNIGTVKMDSAAEFTLHFPQGGEFQYLGVLDVKSAVLTGMSGLEIYALIFCKFLQ